MTIEELEKELIIAQKELEVSKRPSSAMYKRVADLQRQIAALTK